MKKNRYIKKTANPRVKIQLGTRLFYSEERARFWMPTLDFNLSGVNVLSSEQRLQSYGLPDSPQTPPQGDNLLIVPKHLLDL